MQVDYIKLIKSRNKVMGLKQTLRCIEEKSVECVVLADDAESGYREKIVQKCGSECIAIYNIATSLQLAQLCGITVPTAVCAILK